MKQPKNKQPNKKEPSFMDMYLNKMDELVNDPEELQKMIDSGEATVIKDKDEQTH